MELIPILNAFGGGTVHGEASSHQDSNLTPSLMQLTGRLDAQSDDTQGGSAFNSADLTFDVTFRLDAPHNYVLDANLGTEPTGFTDFELSSALTRTDDNTDIFRGDENDVILQHPPQVLSGVLTPGTYHLFFNTSVGLSNSAEAYDDFNIKLDLTPTIAAVPLPPALWSAASLLSAMAISARLKTKPARVQS